VRYATGWTAFSATTSTDVYLKSNGYNLPIWATVSGGGGGSGDVQIGQRWSVPIYSTVGSGTTLDDVVNSTSLLIASQSGNTLTIPNVGSSATFVMTEGDQTIGGTKSFTNPITISGDGRTQSQITVTGSNARSINFGNVGFGTPTQSVSRKLILKDDSTASVRIGVEDKTTGLTNSRLWLQTGLDGSVDFYRDNIRMTRFDKDNIEFTGATISFGKPATASLFGGYSVNLNVENEAITSDRTITLPISDADDYVVVHNLNPGFTSSTTGFANLVVDAYGSISRGGEIESLGIYSLSGDSSFTGIVTATALSKPTVIVPSGGKTIPAYWWSVGKVVTGKYIGTVTCTSIITTSLKLDLKFGDSLIVTRTLSATNTSTNNIFEIDFMITCRGLGDTGSFFGFMKVKDYGTTYIFTTSENVTLGSATGNTNIDADLDIYITTTTGISITIEQAIIEYKN
jgi:hypothetical protein